MQESQLVERAKSGDTAAFEALVESYQEVAFRVAYLITAETAEAEDAAQDALVKAFYALARFRTDAPFRPWLLRIVANEARNRRRAASRRTNLALRTVTSPDNTQNIEDLPEAHALAEEQRRNLLEAVNQLREDDRLVIAYRFFLDLSEQEMADALNCPRGTVKSRLSRALGRLREVLATGATPSGSPEGAPR